MFVSSEVIYRDSLRFSPIFGDPYIAFVCLRSSLSLRRIHDLIFKIKFEVFHFFYLALKITFRNYYTSGTHFLT